MDKNLSLLAINFVGRDEEIELTLNGVELPNKYFKCPYLDNEVYKYAHNRYQSADEELILWLLSEEYEELKGYEVETTGCAGTGRDYGLEWSGSRNCLSVEFILKPTDK